jgi:hypothetical protein
VSKPATTGKKKNCQYFRKRNSCPKGLSTCLVHFAFVGYNLKSSTVTVCLETKIKNKIYRHVKSQFSVQNFALFFASKIHLSSPTKPNANLELEVVKHTVQVQLTPQKFDRPQCLNTECSR